MQGKSGPSTPTSTGSGGKARVIYDSSRPLPNTFPEGYFSGDMNFRRHLVVETRDRQAISVP